MCNNPFVRIQIMQINSIYKYKQLTRLVLVIILSSILFNTIYLLVPFFDRIMGIGTYLSWHNLFEFISILISFCVFILPYYTYKRNRRLRGIFIGSIFLTMGILDWFHTFSYKGMPYFLIENIGANRATTFWIIARLVGALGVTAGSFIHINKKSKADRKIFVFSPVAVSLVIVIVVTYFPDFLPAMYVEGIGITLIKKVLEYIVIFLLVIASVMYILRYFNKKDESSLRLAEAMVISIFSELAFVSYSSVYDIYNYLGHAYKFISYFIIFKIVFVNNVERPYLALYKARNRLKTYADNLDKVVAKRTDELAHINRKLIEDLEYAGDVQRAMLPDKLPNNELVSFEARYYPAERVSGDFYNIFKLDDRRIGMYIADVSGHGVPAAMLTVFIDRSIKSIKEQEGNKFEVISPSGVLKNLYEAYNKINFKDEVYVVLLYAIFDLETKELTYSSAGMNVQPLIYKGSNEISEVDIKGFPICKLDDVYTAEYIDKTIKLNKGDKILFYTDGLVELRNESTGESFTSERLKELFAECREKMTWEICGKIEKNIFKISEHSKPTDDITFFIMQVN